MRGVANTGGVSNAGGVANCPAAVTNCQRVTEKLKLVLSF